MLKVKIADLCLLYPSQERIAAELLHARFEATGHFYTANVGGRVERLRSVLEITTREQASSPDVVVIMMNPGASRPSNNTVGDGQPWLLGGNKQVVPAIPDVTQHQVMRVMYQCGWRHARVINLSDLRTADSLEFEGKLSVYGVDFPNHSVFSDERRAELNEILGSRSIPVLYAWGLSSKLHSLAKRAMSATKGRTAFGIRPEGELGHYHPLLPRHRWQLAWLGGILADIAGNNKTPCAEMGKS